MNFPIRTLSFDTENVPVIGEVIPLRIRDCSLRLLQTWWTFSWKTLTSSAELHAHPANCITCPGVLDTRLEASSLWKVLSPSSGQFKVSMNSGGHSPFLWPEDQGLRSWKLKNADWQSTMSYWVLPGYQVTLRPLTALKTHLVHSFDSTYSLTSCWLAFS